MRFVAGRGTVAENHRDAFAGQGAVAERCREAALWRSICWLGTVAESHREAFAGRGTVAERLQRGGAMAEHLLARGTVAENHREAFGGQRRRGGAAGRECHGEEDGGTVAESHREAFAGQGRRGREPSGSFRWPGAPWRRAIGKLSLARGAVAESHREAFAGQGHCSGAPSGSSHCRKGRKSHCWKGRKSHCWKGEPLPEIRATAGKVRKGVPLPARRYCSGATGWSLFLMRPLCKLFLYL